MRRDKLLAEQKVTKAGPDDLEKIMRRVSVINPFSALNKNLGDIESIDAVNTTMWKNFAGLFTNIGLTKLAEFCENKHKQALQFSAKKIVSKLKINALCIDNGPAKETLIANHQKTTTHCK